MVEEEWKGACLMETHPEGHGGMSGDPIELSVVVPMFNEEDGLDELHRRLVETLAGPFSSLEFIYVDDGSSDKTWERILELERRDGRVKALGLVRNFGKEIALTAGLDCAQGDWVVPLDADLQDPPELIPAMVERARQGYDVVYGRRTRRLGETAGKKLTAWLFYKLASSLSSIPVPENTGDFRVMSKDVVSALRLVRERNRFMKGVFAWVGFRQCAFDYVRHARFSGQTKWNYLKLVNLAIDGITSFSTKPLRLASYAGLSVSSLAFVFSIFYGVKALLYGDKSPGFPTLIVAVLFLGGIQLLCLGILGEYIGHIYTESKGRPLYLLRSHTGRSENDVSSAGGKETTERKG